MTYHRPVRLRDGSEVDPGELNQLADDYDRWNRARCNAAAEALHTPPNDPDGTCGHSPTYPTGFDPCPVCGSVGLRRSELLALKAAS